MGQILSPAPRGNLPISMPLTDSPCSANPDTEPGAGGRRWRELTCALCAKSSLLSEGGSLLLGNDPAECRNGK